MIDRLDLWQPKQRDTAEQRNQVVRAVQQLVSATGGGVIPHSADNPPFLVERFVALVHHTGPTGEEPDWTDSRYFLRLIGWADAEEDAKIELDPYDVDADGIVVATNLSEYDAATGGTHTLQKEMPVLVFAFTSGDGCKHYVFQATKGFKVLRGTVTAIPECGNTVTVDNVTDRPVPEVWTLYLTYPNGDVVRKHFAVGNVLLFLPFGATDDHTGIALGPDVGGVELLKDGVAQTETGKLSHLDVINTHFGRDDFSITMLPSTGSGCAFDKAELEWKAIDVESYPAALTGVRRFEFQGSTTNPELSLPSASACVRFSTVMSGDQLTAMVSGIVPMPVVHPDDKWLQRTAGENCNTSDLWKHIGPDEESATSTAAPISISFDGCTLTLIPPKAKVDATGHWLGWEAGSVGDAVTAAIPTKTIEVPGRVNGGTISNCAFTPSYDSATTFDVIDCAGGA